ncbi:MAG: hypothetical protein HY540_04120, partial [Deltaproteobacteria bacterium]|nr:hypothetical protein [Deltaproteobacteria bacterium]
CTIQSDALQCGYEDRPDICDILAQEYGQMQQQYVQFLALIGGKAISREKVQECSKVLETHPDAQTTQVYCLDEACDAHWYYIQRLGEHVDAAFQLLMKRGREKFELREETPAPKGALCEPKHVI